MRKTLIALTAAGALGVGSAALAAGGHGHSAGGGGGGGGSAVGMSGGGGGGGGSAVGMSRGSVGMSGPMTTGKSVGGPGWGSPTMRTSNIGRGPGRGATNFKSTNLKSTNLKSINLKTGNLKNVQLTGHKKSVIIFRNHHHRRVFVDLAFFGVFADFPSCWEWTWTPWGWQRVFVCDVPPWAWG